jgi:hypothetical protein
MFKKAAVLTYCLLAVVVVKMHLAVIGRVGVK